MNCKTCDRRMKKNGHDKYGRQQYACIYCRSHIIDRQHSEGYLLGDTKPMNVKDSLDRQYDPTTTSQTESARTKIKKVIQAAVDGFDALDKARLADIVSHDYDLPIGEVNHMIDRIKRANGVK